MSASTLSMVWSQWASPVNRAGCVFSQFCGYKLIFANFNFTILTRCVFRLEHVAFAFQYRLWTNNSFVYLH